MSSFIEKIKNAFFATPKIKRLIENERLFPDATGKRLTYKLRKAPVYRVDTSIEAYNAAIAEVENIYRPRRILLQQLYKQVMRDNHLNSGVRKRQNMLLSQKFSINDPQGRLQPEKTKLLERLWFFRLQEIFVETEFYGHSLIELGKQNEQGEFTEIYLIPRELVIPDIACVLSDTLSETPISYKNEKGQLLDYLIEIGEPHDLGLLENITPKIIMKKYALSDWSRHSERFGMPTVHIKTNTNDRKQLDAYEDMGANLGGSGYIITDSETEVINLEASKQDAYKIYQEMVNLCNAEISKAISGETGTTEEKSFVGSAEVHERILRELGDTDSLYFKYFVNYTLLPMLKKYGYPFTEQDTFDWQKSQSPQAPKNRLSPEGQEKASTKAIKKKPNSSIARETKEPAPVFKSLTSLIENLLERLFNGSLKKGGLDADYQSYFEKELQKATTKGYGVDFFQLEPNSPYYDNLQKIYNFQNSFVAHKNYKFISELADALRDENGEIKPFAKFKEEAMKIHSTWNKQWFKSEYNMAVTGATMARQWQELQADKELFPNLQFKTAFDENVRDAHQKLHNVIRPINDDFWKTHYPPLGWGCRCSVIQRTTEATITSDTALAGLPNPDEGFDTNVGITGQVFNPQKNPYYKNIPQADRDKIEIFARKILPSSGITPFDFASKYINEIAQVSINEPTDKILKEWLGNDYHKVDVFNLAGGFASDALAISKLEIKHDENSKSVKILIATDKNYLRRYLKKDGNNLVVKNDLQKSKGLGTKSFTNQILTSLKLGVDRLEANPIRTNTANGYYTSARWGFQYDNEYEATFLRLVAQSDNPKIKKAKTLADLLETKKGIRFWKENGFSFFGNFVVDYKSVSFQIFKEYYMSKFEENQKAFDKKAKELEQLAKEMDIPESEEPMTLEEAEQEDEELKIWEIFQRANKKWRRLNNIEPDEQD